ncbi:GNAT family N-acetyltransferase [Clostridium sp. D2Q-11]|uniref:GNAT family N-acetyltransferase n=1 Tax=Anaeromonas frigoriresistens TaxID=2683708 RepID=A0A942Z6X1_9FIRM|nr:GNAT family N-acetyltransferase [Anaeromonas frigoriresistens]MBS4538926.1 GNAT family N-acetyltransferase [Anaeromonas frigoriresistens]
MIKVNPNKAIFNIFENKLEVKYVFQSMIEGNTPCEVYIDDEVNPSIMVIWDTKNTFYFGENNATADEKKKAIEFIRKEIIYKDDKKKLEIGKLYYSSPVWKDFLIELFNNNEPRVFQRHLYKHSGKLNTNIILDPSVKIIEITKDILNNDSLENISELIDEIRGMWGTKEAFLNEGFGYCTIVNDNTIAGWCTAEYMSESSCGCGVETIEEYQRKGYATIMATKMAGRANELSLDLYWDSWSWNEGSVKTAEKSNYNHITDYEVLFVEL